MGRKNSQPPVKKSAQEIRADVKSYIRNERDTILKKWMALEESVKREDQQRSEFFERRTIDDTRILPTNIEKFIGTLRRAVRKTMRDKGGTPFSIIRTLFLYWDADKSGEVSSKELQGVMDSLGVIMTEAERNEVVAYYDSGKGTHEMDYMHLLRDIQRGEPSMMAFVDKHEEDLKNASEARFKEVTDEFQEMPELVRQFVEAVRNFVSLKMRDDGGTPFYHVRYIFQFYDYDYSGGLCAAELKVAALRAMNLKVTDSQAQEIIRYYDRRGTGELEYNNFLPDIAIGVQPILHHVEQTPRSIAQAKASLSKNPFIPRPFQAAPNKILENFKRDIRLFLEDKVRRCGGTIQSWLKEAFSVWDPRYTKVLSDVPHLVGVAKRLGVTLPPEDAIVIMNSYDKHHSGDMDYYTFMDDVLREEPHFLTDSSALLGKTPMEQSATSRTPGDVNRVIQIIRTAAEAFSRKSKGFVQSRDILHGTCLRFDSQKTGRLNLAELRQVVQEIRAHNLCNEDLEGLMTWFDSNGSGLFDINLFFKQVFGEDISTKTIVLPRLGINNSGTVSMNTTPTTTTTTSSSTLLTNNFNNNNNNNSNNNNNTTITTTTTNNNTNNTNNTNGSVSSYFLPSNSMTHNNSTTTMMKASRSTLNDSNAHTFLASNGVMMDAASMEKNLQAIESQSVKIRRNQQKKKEILSERAKVEAKLASIEEQRQAIIEDYKIRHPKPKW